MALLLAVTVVPQMTGAFYTPSGGKTVKKSITTTTTKVYMAPDGSSSSPFDRLTGLFGDSSNSNSVSLIPPKPPSSIPPPSANLVNNPEALFAKAKTVLNADLGVADPSLLADDANFVYIGGAPNSLGQVLSKQDYLAAAQFFGLREAFPDLDYRAHDFRIVDALEDEGKGLTVRVTARVVGTMRGQLRLRTETLEPTGRRMVCPPEAITMTFDPLSGKVVKLCAGFTMDRLVGNTRGLCGVLAAATCAGAPPSEWETYPPSVVVKRFFGRTVRQLEEPRTFVAPFPETVMISLAKGVIAAQNGIEDPDLLSDDFTYCGPVVGPLPKEEFLRVFEGFNLQGAFPDLDESYTNFRVDPYDPYRVWADLITTGTRTGQFAFNMEPTNKRVVSHPEAVSFTFDDDGFCTRLTDAAIMDPSLGNAGGLGGVYGLLYGSGSPLVDTSTRPWPQIQLRLQKTLSSPLTGVGVDEYKLSGGRKESSGVITTPPATILKPPPNMPKLDNRFEAPKAPVIPPPKISLPKVESPKVSLPKVEPPKVSPPKVEPPKISLPKIATPPPAPKVQPSKAAAPKAAPKSKAKVPISDDPADPVTEAFSTLFGTKAPASSPAKLDSSASSIKAQAEARRRELEAKKLQVEAQRLELIQQRELKLKQLEKEREAQRQAAIAKREEAQRAMEQKKVELEKLKTQRTNVAKAKQVVKEAAPGVTISLASLFGSAFGFDTSSKKNDEAETEPIKPAPVAVKADLETTVRPPKGVPVLNNWRRNFDGSITGKVSGRGGFEDGDLITTSRIANGTIKSGNLVETASGSKYFLS